MPDTWKSVETQDSNRHLDESLITLSPYDVLGKMLDKMGKNMADRYQDYLTKDKALLFDELRQYVTPKAWNVFESLDYSREK